MSTPAAVVSEVIGITDDGELVEIYVEVEYHRPVLWIMLFGALPWAVLALVWVLF